MYPFVALCAALLVSQAEPAEPPGEGQPTHEPAPARPEPVPRATEATPAPAERPTPRAAAAPAAEKPAAPARAAEPERTQVARAALAFLDALLAGDEAAVAAASAERFSFDGESRSGKSEVRRTWREILAGRDPAQRAKLLDLEILPAPEAVARLGPPPPRIAPLATARGTWVAIANVSRQPVVLFLAREGARWAVAGME